MSDLDKNVVMECYNKLHRIVGRYMNDEHIEEAFEAVVLLASTAINTKCIYFKINAEQTLEETFDSIADYTLEMLEDDDEED